MSLTIRGELPVDCEAISAVIATAFTNDLHTGQSEQTIVTELRKAGQLSLSLVAEEQETLVGHVASSQVTISDGSLGWYGLGPLSVMPGWQNQGIGSKLVRTALNKLRLLGMAGCVVLGEPLFYSRFGFRVVTNLVLPDVPPEYFQAVLFHGLLPNGIVRYHEAYNV